MEIFLNKRLYSQILLQ